MNKVVLAGFAAAMLGAFLAPVSNACDNLHTSSFTVSTPLSCDPCATSSSVLLEKQVAAPVLIDRDLTAPVLIDNSYSLPAVIDTGVSMPAIIERDRHLIDFDSPVLRFGLF